MADELPEPEIESAPELLFDFGEEAVRALPPEILEGD
jgi:hypothetical protein